MKTAGLLTLLLLHAGLTAAQTPSMARPVRSRDTVLADYRSNYLEARLDSTGWNGDAAWCRPGTLPPVTYTKMLQQLNFFRRMAGYREDAVFDPMLSPALQQTVTMMEANNNIDHRPPADWKCWSEAAADGARYSNLHMGSTATNCIFGFMQDDGYGNYTVGHRRYILESRNNVFGFGATERIAALQVFTGYHPTEPPPFIAWPPAGYVPQELVFNRWSLCVPGGKFDSASVTMKGPAGKVKLRITDREADYGDPGIVWEPDGILRSAEEDTEYEVRVSGIREAEKQEYLYKVIIIKP